MIFLFLNTGLLYENNHCIDTADTYLLSNDTIETALYCYVRSAELDLDYRANNRLNTVGTAFAAVTRLWTLVHRSRHAAELDAYVKTLFIANSATPSKV